MFKLIISLINNTKFNRLIVECEGLEVGIHLGEMMPTNCDEAVLILVVVLMCHGMTKEKKQGIL